MITFIIAIALIALFPFIMRTVFALIGIVAVIGVVAMARADAQQPTQTRCYQAGPTQVCETKDRTTGAVISSSRCYQSGSGQTCDTQSFGSSSSSSGTVIPAPSFNPPRR